MTRRLTLAAGLTASLFAVAFSTLPSAAQDGGLASAVFDAQCADVLAETLAEEPPFNAAATMSLAGFIAGYASEVEAREMLVDLERLDAEFARNCRHEGATFQGAMQATIEQYLDGF